MNLTYKIGGAVATMALLGSLMASTAFAGGSVDPNGITVSGNGTGSHNKVKVSSSSDCDVSQANSSVITTGITAKSKTGGNKANKNTGGGVTIGTGDASTSATVGVTGSSNSATNPCCACQTAGTPDITISGNGDHSHNKVTVWNGSSTDITQSNSSVISTSVNATSGTGGNNANSNTGPGSVGITTGDATTTVSVTVGGSTNTL